MSFSLPYVTSKLDALLYRYPFEGPSASRYSARARCGFGDLDRRLIDRMAVELALARTVLDVGSGPGVFAARLAAAHPTVRVLALEPGGDFARATAPVREIRGRAESLPLATDSIDLAICLSTIRHVADRERALGELRRVVVRSGAAYIVELDPAASRQRIRNHARRMRSWSLRLSFGPLVVRTAPPSHEVARLARRAGWNDAVTEPDTLQPVYVMRLS